MVRGVLIPYSSFESSKMHRSLRNTRRKTCRQSLSFDDDQEQELSNALTSCFRANTLIHHIYPTYRTNHPLSPTIAAG